MISGMVLPLMYTSLFPSSTRVSVNLHEMSAICISKIRSLMYEAITALVLLRMVGSSGSWEVCLYSMSIIAMVKGNVTTLNILDASIRTSCLSNIIGYAVP